MRANITSRSPSWAMTHLIGLSLYKIHHGVLNTRENIFTSVDN